MKNHVPFRRLREFLPYLLFIIVLSSSTLAETVADYDGDGKTDCTIIRFNRVGNIGRGTWWTLRSNDGRYTASQWGGYDLQAVWEDLPVFGDFDGDGKTDIAVYRKAYITPAVQTYFYILRSSDSTMIAQQWGLSNDYEVSQDYDGDSKTDIAVVRETPQGNVWYMLQSRDGYRIFNQGGGGYPLRGDYDGDRRADFAVAAGDSNNNWNFYIWSNRVPHSLTIKQLGNSLADYIVPGDYDGDGKTDVAVWRGVNKNTSGVWQWIRSSDNQIGGTQLGIGFGQGDYPVPGDYDGDGKTDPAIYRRGVGSPQNIPAYFHIRGSQRGFYTVQWGLDIDLPPLFYRAT